MINTVAVSFFLTIKFLFFFTHKMYNSVSYPFDPVLQQRSTHSTASNAQRFPLSQNKFDIFLFSQLTQAFFIVTICSSSSSQFITTVFFLLFRLNISYKKRTFSFQLTCTSISPPISLAFNPADSCVESQSQ